MLIIRGGVVLTLEPGQSAINDGAVVVEGEDIVAVGNYHDLKRRYPHATIMGSEQHWVLPGFVNSHSHCGLISGSFRQGIIDLPLERWLMRLYNSGLAEGQAEMIYLNTQYYCAQLVKSGVTCTCDFYYGHSNSPYMGSEYGLRGYQDSGMRVAFFLAALDQSAVDNGNLDPFFHLLPPPLLERAKALGPIPYNISRNEFLQAWLRIHRDFNGVDGILNINLGPDGPTRCSPEFFQMIKRTASDHGANIQMHILETKYQRMYGFQSQIGSLVGYLDDLGFLGPEVSLAHSTWMSREDLELVSRSGSSTVYNASSNLRLCDGISPVHEMLAKDINVALGTDNFGFSDDNDLFDELRLATLLQRVPGIEGNVLSGRKALEMATINGARALGLADRTGSLAPGKAADIVTIDSNRMLSPFMSPVHEPEEVFWRRARREDVRDVLINGKIVLKDGELATIDVNAVGDSLKEKYDMLWETRGEKEQNIFNVLREVDPYVIEYFQQLELSELKPGYIFNTR